MTEEEERLRKKFESEWAALVAAEERASDVATQYGIGEAQMTLKDVDAAFAEMKKPLKTIRKLATELRKKNEQSDPQ